MSREQVRKISHILQEILYHNGLVVAENANAARRCTEIAKLALAAMDTLENMRNGEK